MSGYKNGYFQTQEEHQAFGAFAAWHSERLTDEDELGLLDIWEDMNDGQKAGWFRAAEAVRHDTRSEPRY